MLTTVKQKFNGFQLLTQSPETFSPTRSPFSTSPLDLKNDARKRDYVLKSLSGSLALETYVKAL